MSVKVSIINIGNELLLGRTVNTNLSWLGNQLAEIGLPITKSVTIQDDPQEIQNTLRSEWRQNDIVIITGGLGPTDDDLTKKTIADFFGKKLEFREEVWMDVQEIFTRRSLQVPEINRSQAMVPEGFVALRNTVGTAPGLYFTQDGKSLFALPGVPLEMKNLFENHISAILKNKYQCNPVIIRQIRTWNISESALAEKLKDVSIPEEIKLAWLPQTGRVDLRIYGYDKDLIEKCLNQIREIAQEWVWGEDEDTPQTILYEFLTKKNLTLAVAESCTGGLVQQLITSVPGASKYFNGGIVSYSNEIKINQLKVKSETIDKSGAVSVETAAEMALGVRTEFKADIGISVTGIAGPEGGSKEKPVGTVCFGISDKSQLLTTKVVFNGTRDSIRFKAAEFVIIYLIKSSRSQA